MPVESSQITDLLNDWATGDKRALDRLVPLVYSELRLIAHQWARRERNVDLQQTTALVHEAYLRLVSRSNHNWHNRVHFFAASATVIRSILVDQARARSAAKRGSGAVTISLNDAVLQSNESYRKGGCVGVLELEVALDRLAIMDPRLSRLIELRFYGGLTNKEAADALGISIATVKRDWNISKAWLSREMAAERS